MDSKEAKIPDRIQEQMAIEIGIIATTPNLTVSTIMMDAASSTIMHCPKGRKNHEEEGERNQKL